MKLVKSWKNMIEFYADVIWLVAVVGLVLVGLLIVKNAWGADARPEMTMVAGLPAGVSFYATASPVTHTAEVFRHVPMPDKEYAKYFQPTVEQYNCCFREIAEQQKEYEDNSADGQTAVEKQQWTSARSYWISALESSVFHFQMGWRYNDIGFSYLQQAGGVSRMTEFECGEALQYLASALHHFKAEKIGKYQAEAKDGLEKAGRTRRHVMLRLELLRLE